MVKCNGKISLETKVIRPLCCGAFTSSVPNTLYIYKPQKCFLNKNHSYLVIAGCVHRRVVEGSGVGSAGCAVHFDVHGA